MYKNRGTTDGIINYLVKEIRMHCPDSRFKRLSRDQRNRFLLQTRTGVFVIMLGKRIAGGR